MRDATRQRLSPRTVVYVDASALIGRAGDDFAGRLPCAGFPDASRVLAAPAWAALANAGACAGKSSSNVYSRSIVPVGQRTDKTKFKKGSTIGVVLRR